MKEQNNEIKQWGGKREGAGRPKTTAKRYGFCAPDDVVTILENLDCERTEFILSAIRFYSKTKGM